MNKNILFVIIVAIAVLLEMVLFLTFGGGAQSIASYFHKNSTPVPGMILFYGNNCSHCLQVDAFITENNIDKKVSFTRLEIANNIANKNMLADKAQICGLNPAVVGVPFLWDGKKCIVGDVDIINYFKSIISKKP